MDAQQAKTVFRGPMVSVATPFTEGFELDLDALRNNIRFMVEPGRRAKELRNPRFPSLKAK